MTTGMGMRAKMRARGGVCGRRARLRTPALAVVAAVALGVLGAPLAGCGGGSSASTTTVAVVPSSPAASTATDAAGASAVADVDGAPISKAAYQHWLAVERKLGAAADAGHRALAFLITSQWVLAEASARRLAVSDAEVRHRYEQVVRQSFPKPGQLRQYLARAGESEADLLARIKVELLTAKIAAQVTAGKSGSARTALLDAFERDFHARWKALTSCQPGYVMEDCKQYTGAPEDLTPKSASGASAGAGAAAHGGSSSTSGSTNGAASASGEVYTAPGAFSLSSSAFERNGQIPAEYTCAGAGISPPLSWTHVPAHAAELVLFVIDDTAQGAGGGIRWIVGGIDPSSTGVAAGQTPTGGILGTNSAGHAAYSPICPAPGHSDTIEFVMYALSKPIALSSGFAPAQAESEYGGSHKLLLGQAAATYGVASR